MAWVTNVIEVRNLLDEAFKKLHATGNTEAADILRHSFRYKIPQWQVDDAQLNKFYVVNYPLLEGARVEVPRGEQKTNANSL